MLFSEGNDRTIAGGATDGRTAPQYGYSMDIEIIDRLAIRDLIENWVGKREVPSTDPYGPVKGYFLTNLTLTTQKLFDKRINASISIRNLFGTNYLDPGIRSADGYIYSTVLEQPGINGLFKIGVNL